MSKLKTFRDAINKSNKKSLLLLGSDVLESEIKGRIPTGWSLLDLSMGGGLPLGRTVELYGRESSCKSTLAIQAMKQCQDMGGFCVVFDPESSFYKAFAEKIGVDLEKVLIISSEVVLESSFNIFVQVIDMVHDEFPDKPILIVWDTLAATPTKKEMEEQEDGGRMSPQYRAQVIRKGMRSITSSLAKASACLLIINHVYDSAGMNGMIKTETPGGRGVKFASSVRIHLKTQDYVKESADSEPIGVNILAKVEKNKLGMPRREVKSAFIFGKGFNDQLSIFNYAVDIDLIKQSGSWYSYKFKGKDTKFYASQFLSTVEKHPDMFEEIKAKVIEEHLKYIE